jgi:DNA invertase Pin-like site-specific DNA recombinase
MITKAIPSQIIGYYRVSTKEQGADGLGMAAQRDAVERYAAGIGLPIVASFEEVESGSKANLKNRPQLVAAMAHARRSRSLLVIARLDRLARNVYVTSQLLESGVEFVACDNPHASRLTIHILAAMAEHESALISARVKASVQANRARGVVYKNYSKLTPEAMRRGVEASRLARIKRTREVYEDLVPMIREWRLAGEATHRIADRLNALGHRNQAGRPWMCESIRILLRREGLGHLKPTYACYNLTPADQAKGTVVASAASRQRTIEFYEPFIELMRGLHAAGLSSVSIAVEMNSRGLKTQGGSSWYPSIVQDVLRRAGITGPRVPGGQGLKSAAVNAEGRRRALLRLTSIAEAHRERIMPIITWLRGKGLLHEQIAGYLNANGYTTPRSLRWSATTVRSFTYRVARAQLTGERT